jgi:hypothetical protein
MIDGASSSSEDTPCEYQDIKSSLASLDGPWTRHASDQDPNSLFNSVSASQIQFISHPGQIIQYSTMSQSQHSAGAVAGLEVSDSPNLNYSTLSNGMMPLWMFENSVCGPGASNSVLETAGPQSEFCQFEIEASSSPTSTPHHQTCSLSLESSPEQVSARRKRSPMTTRRLLHLSARIRSAKVESDILTNKLDVPFTGVLKFRVKEPPKKSASKSRQVHSLPF